MKQEISDQMIVSRHFDGVKLLKPERLSENSRNMNVTGLIKLPFDVFFVKADLALAKVNESVAATCGDYSPLSLTGKKAQDIFEGDSADFMVRWELDTMTNAKMQIREYDTIRKDGVIHHVLSMRMPWYDQEDKIAGVLGYAVVIGKHSLKDAMLEFSKQGLINHSASSENKINNTYFSKREWQCLKYLVRGKTMRDIGGILGLSCRTVEYYIENIKQKLCVTTKSELIDLVFDHFT